MKMPEYIDSEMFAPCGMNCLVCYRHCYHKKPCEGCLRNDRGKPEHCRRCRIKDCIREKSVCYCYQCPDYPCRQIKALEKSYNTRYHASLVDNSRAVKEQGVAAFLKKQREIYTCPMCGGVMSIHDAECSECQYRMGDNVMEQIPDKEELYALTGEVLGRVWTELCETIDGQYDMERLWNPGGKAWDYEYKYRRGGKTLCALYARKNCIGFMVILGKAEREKFENHRAEFSAEVQTYYDDAETYHDGKWIMFLPEDTAMLEDFMKLLKLKRRPNRK